MSAASCQPARHTADVTSLTFEGLDGKEKVLLSPPFWCAPDSSVGIATRYGAGRSGDQILVVARFSLHVQTGPRAHPASYTKGNGSFLGAKRPGRGADHPPTYTTEVKERVHLYLYSTWAFVASYMVTFTFTVPLFWFCYVTVRN